nr:LysM peptidoglycan-binding domain-containing protein [Alicyclobacillus macrosporangiidus]
MRIKRYAGIGLLLAGIETILVLRLLPPELTGWKQVVVNPGQTVWSIAETQCPADTRYVVDAIVQHNHIRDAMQLKPGDVLEVPTKAEPLWNRLVFR